MSIYFILTKKNVGLTMICNCLRIENMMNISLKYIYLLFSCIQGFYGNFEERKNMLYLKI